MITQEVAMLIYNCYSEIKNAKQMIEEMKNSINEKGEFELEDEWHRNKKHLSLHIPSQNSSSYSVRQLPHQLAVDCLVAHIEKQEQELIRLKTVCKTQLL